ncbi:MAG: hypothetical protein OSA45_12990 [Halioglobus sp.]|jgi:uncharacterized membrane protein YwzB|nr:hypothetical protein [Halioglobus sp.]|tara:strand:- start:325 stop:708 length:384 start_codon:yes stop_codon:yes gene_type:complete
MTHPLAPHGLPSYIGGADGSDPLLTAVTFILIIGLMGVVVLYFKLHSIPEHLAQKQNNTQTQLIMVLAVLALFTHNHLFWVAALVLALIKIPDFITPLNSIASSLRNMADTPTEPEISASNTDEHEQ